MRALTLSLLPLVLLVAACDEESQPDLKEPLKLYLSKKLRDRGFKVNLTDDDPRARPPTKYAEAAKGVAFTHRHACVYEDSDVTVSTWIYSTKKDRDTALKDVKPEDGGGKGVAPFDLMVKDLRKGDVLMLYRIEKIDTKSLHGIVILETLNTGLTNQFTLLTKEIVKDLETVK